MSNEKIDTMEDIINYVKKNWKYIRKEELLDLFDHCYNIGYCECEYTEHDEYNSRNNRNIEQEIEEEYNEGYSEGYREGLEEGHREGHSEGYSEGYSDGKRRIT